MEWIESLSPYPTTMGIVYRFTYDRRPGLLIRFTPVITGESPWYLMPIRSMNLARFQIFHSTHIAFLKKNFCNSKFQPRMRKFTTRKPAMDAFFICANKSPTGSFTIYLLVCASRLYQDTFITPGKSPLCARARKHNRQIPNFLMYARDLPQREHRLRWRT